MPTTTLPTEKKLDELFQIRLRGRLKASKEGELITFIIPLGPIEIACIVNIPFEGKDFAPVYVKFKKARFVED